MCRDCVLTALKSKRVAFLYWLSLKISCNCHKRQQRLSTLFTDIATRSRRVWKQKKGQIKSMLSSPHWKDEHDPLTLYIRETPTWVPGADPGFLEREFICIKVWGFALLILYHFS